MKLLMISFALAGAGSLAVGASRGKMVDDTAPEFFNKLGEIKPKSNIETFILAPHPQCVVSTESLDTNSIIGECLTNQRKWLKAI
jgi:hypothetical protein|tara:strand:+ start:144 stop:398 length:255 start_codon:yes stop_codon:yes gene_type:complete